MCTHSSHMNSMDLTIKILTRIQYYVKEQSKKKKSYPLKSFYIDIPQKWTSSTPTSTSTLKETPKRFAITANSLEMIYVVSNKSHTRSLGSQDEQLCSTQSILVRHKSGRDQCVDLYIYGIAPFLFAKNSYNI